MPTILITDDDIKLCQLLESVLLEEHYEVFIAHNGEEALQVLSEQNIDLLLLDVMMPVLDGLQTARQVCRRFSTPILMLTAMGDESSKIEGFEAGADHYLAKPFSVPELLVRIKSIFRRVAFERARSKNTIISQNNHKAIQSLPFTNTESELVNYLKQRQGHAVSKKDLQTHVLQRSFCEFDRNLDMHISNIRRKLTHAGLSKNIIFTVRGVGYTFDEQRS